MVRRLHLGGVVALEQNIASLSQIRGVNRSVARVVARRGFPAFIAVDQEGGVVRRVHLGVTQFPAFMSAGAADDTALTRRTSRISAAEMRGLGFDVMLAPVADVSVGDRDAVVGSRAAGGRPGLVARHVVAAIEGIEAAGVLPVVKHFSGHGSLEVDSHRALPMQRRPMHELRATDLVPFAAAIRAQAPAVMTGHIAVRVLDADVPRSPIVCSPETSIRRAVHRGRATPPIGAGSGEWGMDARAGGCCGLVAVGYGRRHLVSGERTITSCGGGCLERSTRRFSASWSRLRS